jgi:hypothetical protein
MVQNPPLLPLQKMLRDVCVVFVSLWHADTVPEAQQSLACSSWPASAACWSLMFAVYMSNCLLTDVHCPRGAHLVAGTNLTHAGWPQCAHRRCSAWRLSQLAKVRSLCPRECTYRQQSLTSVRVSRREAQPPSICKAACRFPCMHHFRCLRKPAGCLQCSPPKPQRRGLLSIHKPESSSPARPWMPPRRAADRSRAAQFSV